jgi:subtilase family serine protease
MSVECWNGSLTPNATGHISFSVLGSSTPTTAIATLVADPDNTIPELNENNNQMTVSTSFV